MTTATSRPQQAITGLMPPQLGESPIREAWPTVLGINAPLAALARTLLRTFLLAPLGIFLLAPLFLLKFSPFLCRRFTLTNRRIMVQRGWKPSPVQSVALADIEEVRLDPASIDPFFLSGTLEIISRGQVALRLDGVPEPEGFRHAIQNAVVAWVPGKTAGHFQPASAVKLESPSAG